MKKILFIAVLSFGFMANAMAQHFDDEEEVVEKKVVEKKVEEKKVEVIEQSESDEVFEVVDKMPSFPGGQAQCLILWQGISSILKLRRKMEFKDV